MFDLVSSQLRLKHKLQIQIINNLMNNKPNICLEFVIKQVAILHNVGEIIMLNSDRFLTLLKCSHTCSCLKRKMKKTGSERRIGGERKDRDVFSVVAVLLKCTIVQAHELR